MHFVAAANKEQLFLKLKGESESKHEFTLNAQTKDGQLEELKNDLGSRTEVFTFQSLSEEEDKKSLRSLDEQFDYPEDAPEDTPGESKKSEESKKSKKSKKTKSSDWKTLNIKKNKSIGKIQNSE